jgi:hypothetical protein
MNRLAWKRRRANRDGTRLLKVERASVNVPPQIRLKGLWLERLAGFRPGALARVSLLARGMLVIEQLP